MSGVTDSHKTDRRNDTTRITCGKVFFLMRDGIDPHDVTSACSRNQ